MTHKRDAQKHLTTSRCKISNRFSKCEHTTTHLLPFLKPYCIVSLSKHSPHNSRTIYSNSLDNALDNVIPLYMFTNEASTCLSLSKGIIKPTQKSRGRKQCRMRELNNKHRCICKFLSTYAMCSLIIPSQPVALFFFNRRTHDSTHSMSIKAKPTLHNSPLTSCLYLSFHAVFRETIIGCKHSLKMIRKFLSHSLVTIFAIKHTCRLKVLHTEMFTP